MKLENGRFPGCLTQAELAIRLGVTVPTLCKWRSGQPGRPRRGPAYIKAFGRVWYRETDVDSWLMAILKAQRIVPGYDEKPRRRRAA